jgi:hypothetical protein
MDRCILTGETLPADRSKIFCPNVAGLPAASSKDYDAVSIWRNQNFHDSPAQHHRPQLYHQVSNVVESVVPGIGVWRFEIDVLRAVVFEPGRPNFDQGDSVWGAIKATTFQSEDVARESGPDQEHAD